MPRRQLLQMKAESICPENGLALNRIASVTLFAALLYAILSMAPSPALAQTHSTSSGQAASTSRPASEARSEPDAQRQVYIQEYRVVGTHKLSELEVEEAV